MSDRMAVKVLKREAEWTKMPTSTPARPLTVPIKQRVATYIKTRNRIFAQGSSDLVKASGVVKMVNPWGILADIPEQTITETACADAKNLRAQGRSCAPGMQSAADTVLANVDTVDV